MLLSAPLQNDLRFFQHPLPAIPSAFLADAPAFTGRQDVGFAMFGCDDTDDLAPAYTPAVVLFVCPSCTAGQPDCVPFWLEPVSAFGSLQFTVPLAVHVC